MDFIQPNNCIAMGDYPSPDFTGQSYPAKDEIILPLRGRMIIAMSSHS